MWGFILLAIFAIIVIAHFLNKLIEIKVKQMEKEGKI